MMQLRRLGDLHIRRPEVLSPGDPEALRSAGQGFRRLRSCLPAALKTWLMGRQTNTPAMHTCRPTPESSATDLRIWWPRDAASPTWRPGDKAPRDIEPRRPGGFEVCWPRLPAPEILPARRPADLAHVPANQHSCHADPAGQTPSRPGSCAGKPTHLPCKPAGQRLSLRPQT